MESTPDTSPEEFDALVETYTARITEMESAYRAWECGELHPDDEAYEKIWSGREPGVGGEQIRREREAARNLRQMMISLGVAPDSETLTGIDEYLGHLRRAEESHGRSLSSNQSTVYWSHREAARRSIGLTV